MVTEPESSSLGKGVRVSGAGAWRIALAATALLLIGLGWLLARLLWLPAYFGLFFFFIAGLIAGGVTFRLATPCRPVSRGRLLRGIAVVAALSTCATVVWEYHKVALTVADPPAFAGAKNAAIRESGSTKALVDRAIAEFKAKLKRSYPPGGPIGYVRWAVSTGVMNISLDNDVERVTIPHRRFAWAGRTIASFLLTAAGLWLSFDALRSDVPVTNVLKPGEEYEEIE